MRDKRTDRLGNISRWFEGKSRTQLLAAALLVILVLVGGGLLFQHNRARLKLLATRSPRPLTGRDAAYSPPLPARVGEVAVAPPLPPTSAAARRELSVVRGYDVTAERFPWEDAASSPAAEVAQEPGIDWKALGREVAETIVLTLLIFVVMRALIQNYRIEGYSMEPNLHEQQYLIVNKVAYYLGEPKRGDIIVFEYPKGDPNGPERDYIKRIIGLPGDTVECRPGEILVNGQVIEEPYGPNPWSYSCPATTLGPYEYFVLGDNRPQSSDSHQWGTLERKYIIGKAWFSYWPLNQWGWVPNYPIQAPDPLSSLAHTPDG